MGNIADSRRLSAHPQAATSEYLGVERRNSNKTPPNGHAGFTEARAKFGEKVPDVARAGVVDEPTDDVVHGAEHTTEGGSTPVLEPGIDKGNVSEHGFFMMSAQLNLQVRISPEMETAILELAPGAKSAFVREAILEKIAREKARRLEHQWIDALALNPESTEEAEVWLAAESWGIDGAR